ncbi:MAG TPA: ATP-binding cassette domain-containing protein [Fimbriimonas sp.]|nr:ATP-binding cassette domain-containing protein [Fimbriimonas sp.]
MISVKGLTKAFDGHPVLKDISLEANQGEILAIMGSSGGGKTTLLRCISGLLAPTSGSVVVDGLDVQKHPEEARRRMGMVFQSAALFDYMNVTDNVLFGIERRLKIKAKERVDTARLALERVGLQPEDAVKMPSELSGGMRKRVGIARALALNPMVMLYDEPTTGLDPITVYNIDSLMVGIRNERNMTSIVISHDLGSVMRIADRIAFLHHGRVIFWGTHKDFEASSEPAIRELVDKSRATSLR